MQHRNLLLIDDDEEDQEIFRDAITQISEELICETYSNARAVLQKLTQQELVPDLIFLDLNMPVMSGQEFLQKVKEQENTRHIPVIIFSTSSNPTTIRQTKEMGAVDFITKPDRFDDLVNVLERIIK